MFLLKFARFEIVVVDLLIRFLLAWFPRRGQRSFQALLCDVEQVLVRDWVHTQVLSILNDFFVAWFVVWWQLLFQDPETLLYKSFAA